jgi:hypothetical protein
MGSLILCSISRKLKSTRLGAKIRAKAQLHYFPRSIKHEIQEKSLLSEDEAKKSRKGISADCSDAFPANIIRLSCCIRNHLAGHGGMSYTDCLKNNQIRSKKSLISDITFDCGIVYNNSETKSFPPF